MAAASTINDKQDVFSTAGAIVRTLPEAQQNQKAFETVVELIKPGAMASSSDQPPAAMDSQSASSTAVSAMAKPNRKQIRKDHETRARVEREKQLAIRKAQCEKAGIP